MVTLVLALGLDGKIFFFKNWQNDAEYFSIAGSSIKSDDYGLCSIKNTFKYKSVQTVKGFTSVYFIQSHSVMWARNCLQRFTLTLKQYLKSLYLWLV